MAASAGGIGSVTSARVRSVMSAIDGAIAKVDKFRSTLGAVQNRFITTVANLQSSIENQSAARSRIMDADFAVETAALSRSQILQQAGTAMLAQANQSGQSVLSLLR
jgi:flagellin